jgi:hypothetical protein
MTGAEVGPGPLEVLAQTIPGAGAAAEQIDVDVNKQMMAVAAGDAEGVASALAAAASVHATTGEVRCTCGELQHAYACAATYACAA